MSDLFYACARVRALETGLLGRDALTRLSDAPSLDACYALLAEYGYTLKTDEKSGKILREESLLGGLRAAFNEITALTENTNSKAFALWRYPYDCNNIKAAIKCFARKTDCDSMLFDFGTVSVDAVKKAVATNDFSAFPDEMAEGAREAVSTFAKTGNPQLIDLILDKACYRQMLSDAKESGVEYAVRLVKTKIDFINLVSCVRVLRMRSGEAGRSLLCEALIDGGEMPADAILALYEDGERGFWEHLLYTDYKRFANAVEGREPSLTAVERAADNVWMSLVREARFISHGEEILIGYLLGVECEVRNVRVILAGKAAGLSSETVWERIRDSYV